MGLIKNLRDNLSSLEENLFEKEEIKWDQVKDSAIEAAKTIFKKVDMKKIDMMMSALKEMEPKNTEVAIQIIVNMMRG